MPQHGPTLPYTAAWILITLASAPDETDLVRAWTTENPDRSPGVHYDQWDKLSPAEQIRRRQWLQRHTHSPIQLLDLDLDVDLIESTGLHTTDWGPPHAAG
ncbi:hypothetical protein [Streptomyces sp. NPDC055099]